MEQITIWIILAVVLGSLVLGTILVLVLFLVKRSKQKMRRFTFRAVTPLDDSVFESWRQPGQHTPRPQNYGIRPTKPLTVHTSQSSGMFEKEAAIFDTARNPSLRDDDNVNDIVSPVRKPEKARRKTSICSSLADRPPTPYSPPGSTTEFPRASFTSRRSYGGSPRVHYPSMSEASAFNFDLKDMSFDSNKSAPIRASTQSDRPLKFSYGDDSYFDKI